MKERKPTEREILDAKIAPLEERSSPGRVRDTYANYLSAINRAMKETGQSVRGRGTHALRFNYAQRRYRQCVAAGMGDEEAKRLVSREMSHNRPDITEEYYA